MRVEIKTSTLDDFNSRLFGRLPLEVYKVLATTTTHYGQVKKIKELEKLIEKRKEETGILPFYAGENMIGEFTNGLFKPDVNELGVLGRHHRGLR